MSEAVSKGTTETRPVAGILTIVAVWTAVPLVARWGSDWVTEAGSTSVVIPTVWLLAALAALVTGAVAVRHIGLWSAWSLLGVVAMWVSVVLVADWGSDFVSRVGADQVRVPSVWGVALAAAFGTWRVAVAGPDRRPVRDATVVIEESPAVADAESAADAKHELVETGV